MRRQDRWTLARRRWLRAGAIACVVVALHMVVTSAVGVYVIPSASMEPTLHGCEGCADDRVLVEKVGYRLGVPAVGDVVVFAAPPGWGADVDGGSHFVKRVIARAGQTVWCCDAANRVVVDGAALDEPYVQLLPLDRPRPQVSFGPVTVPDGNLWMMGDNRNNSSDSRYRGPVPVDRVVGRVTVALWPPSRFGTPVS